MGLMDIDLSGIALVAFLAPYIVQLTCFGFFLYLYVEYVSMEWRNIYIAEPLVKFRGVINAFLSGARRAWTLP